MSWLSWYHVCSGKMTAQDKTTSQCSSLLPLSVHFLLIPQFNQQVLAQTCWFPVSSASFLLLGDGELLFSQKGVLKELSILFCSFVPKNTPGDLIQFFFFFFLNSLKFTLLKLSILTPLLIRSIFLKITNSTRAWLLQNRMFLCFHLYNDLPCIGEHQVQ